MIFVRRHSRGNVLVRAFQRKGPKRDRINNAIHRTINQMKRMRTKGRMRTLAKRYNKLESWL